MISGARHNISSLCWASDLGVSQPSGRFSPDKFKPLQPGRSHFHSNQRLLLYACLILKLPFPSASKSPFHRLKSLATAVAQELAAKEEDTKLCILPHRFRPVHSPPCRHGGGGQLRHGMRRRERTWGFTGPLCRS